MQLYIAQAGQQTGPHSLDEIRSRLQSGVLKPTDFAWYEGAANWMPLSSVPGLGAAPQLRSSAPVVPPTNTKPPRRGLIIVSAIASGLFSIGILLATFLWFAETDGGTHKSLVPLFVGLVAAVIGICLAIQLIVSLRRAAEHCEVCNRPGPTMSVSLNRHIGAVVLMFHKSLRGSLCRECIARVFREFTLTTLFLGWWGFISFLVTPVVLINNLIVYVMSLFMPPSR